MRETMKSIYIAIVLAAMTFAANAAEVSSEEAREAVAGWASLREALGGQFDAEISGVKTYDADKGRFHVVSFEGGGYVVTSADTEQKPILAYSRDGVWVEDESQNPLLVMVSMSVASETAEQESASAGGASSSRLLASSSALSANASKWSRLRAAATSGGRARLLSANEPSSDLRVAPLVTTSWKQKDKGENTYIPNGWRCGCVATMGAQIMRFWKWPDASTNITAVANFYGAIVNDWGGWKIDCGWRASSSSEYTPWNPAFGGTYDWDNMPESGGSSTAQYEAIGKLTRDVGLSCYMQYTSGSSAAPGSVFTHRLVDQFAYANAKSTSGWNDGTRNALLASLDAGLPCGMNVSTDNSGHAIVADGYGYSDGDLFVHFNLGWGYVGTDTWYTPPNINSYYNVDDIIYNIYPPTVNGKARQGDLTIVSGRVLADSVAQSGATVTAVNRETGYTDVATSSDKGVYALWLTPGVYTITAANGSSSARIVQVVYPCISEVWGGNGKRAAWGSVGNVHGLELTLGTGVTQPEAALAHRWSFTDGYSDSVGGSTATPIGSNVVVSAGRAVLSGDGHGDGSLRLGVNLLDTDAATIEIWAATKAARNWARVFDFGTSDTNYFCVTWSQGTSVITDRAASKNPSEVICDNTMAPYELGTMYHISATFERNPNGSTVVRFMRRNAVTGDLEKSGSLTMPNGLQAIADPILYLGYSQYSGDSDACADYDEVRIWQGVLSDAQLSANAAAGPDAIPSGVSAEVRYVAQATWKGGTPTSASDFEDSSNWTCLDQDGKSIDGVPDVRSVVVIPSGEMTFTIPSGVRPSWKSVQFGEGGAETRWGSVGSAQVVGDYATGAHYKVPTTNFTYRGTGNLSYMESPIIHNPGSGPELLTGSQLRYDGWVYVSDAQAGIWTFHQCADDYAALTLDGEVVVCAPANCCGSSTSRRVRAGWHRFTVVEGDWSGVYAALAFMANHMRFPVGVRVNDGPEIAFSEKNFTFGSGSKKVSLAADCDLSGLGTLFVDNATEIDLNGHALKVDGLDLAYLGAVVTNSSENVGRLVEVGCEPVMSYAPASTNFYRTATLEISAEEGQVVRYTTDGSDPTADSAVYDGTLTLEETTTVKARVFKEGYRQSDVVSATFTKLDYWGGRYADTPENRAAHWIEESEPLREATGTWSVPVQYQDGRIVFEGEGAYVADSESAGGRVVLSANLSFHEAGDDAMFDNTRVGVSVGNSKTTDDLTFKVYTREDDERKWLDVTGVVPVLGTDYDMQFDLDLTNKLYSVSVSNGVDCVVLANGAQTKFPFACDNADPVQRLSFIGPGSVGYILGSYGELVVTGFVEGEELSVGDAKRILSAAQAAWLNGLGARAVVNGKIKTLSADAFDDAYLLNLDVTKDGFSAEFKVTKVTVGTDTVEIEVTLTRTGAVMEGDKAKPINGTLLFKGAADIVDDFSTISTKSLSDDDFSDGDTATATFDKVGSGSTTNRFFKANIE